MTTLVEDERYEHRIELVLHTDIAGNALGPESTLNNTHVGAFGVVMCTCGWESDVFVWLSESTPEEIHALHFRDIIKHYAF